MKYAVRLVMFLAFVVLTAIPVFSQKTEAQYIDVGIAQSKAKDYQGAHATYTECINAFPKSAQCLYRRGLVREIAVGYGLALEDYNALNALLPMNPLALGKRGSVYISLKRYDEAIADLTLAITLKPDAEKYYDRSRAYMAKGNEEKQFADLSESIKLEPTQMAYIFRAGIFEKRNDQTSALADYTALIGIEPTYGSGYYRRGKIYFAQGKTDLAEADFAKAISLDPSIKVQVSSLKTLAATDKLLAASKNRPKNPLETIKYAAYAHVEKKEWDLAIAEYTKAIEMAPSDHWLYINRGRAYEGKGDYVKALAEINKGMSMVKPAEAASFRYDRAGIYLKQRNHELALTELKAIMADEKEPNAYTLLLRGKVYAAMGLKTSARSDYEEAIKINRYLTEAKNELAKLDN
jgi:tetratricopeptide (TPR) repeat protein